MGLGKSEVRHSRAVGVQNRTPAQVRQRLQFLRRYRWSSYRAYIGSVKVPSWLTLADLLTLAGKAGQPGDEYREYCEAAIREGARESPWSQVVGPAVLGGERCVARLVAGLEKEEWATRLNPRPSLDQVIAAVEGVRKQKWEEFRDRYGDDGRDLVMYLGRKACGLSFRELSDRVAIKYSSAAAAARRFEARLRKNKEVAAVLRLVADQLHNA